MAKYGNPAVPDTDGDGNEDGLEVRNGTDPLVFDGSDLGIDGLELPAYTLFQPDRYSGRPAVPGFAEYVDGKVFYRHFNDTPVRYDGDENCSELCASIETLAQSRPDDNGWGICIGGFGDCVDDASQERDIVREARTLQGVFDDDGYVRPDFVREQAFLQCTVWTANDDCRRCSTSSSSTT